MIRTAKVLFSLVLGLMLTATLVFGQTETGSISGAVKDASGAVIAGATVKSKSIATGAERTVTTGTIGQYLIQNLNPGTYQVTVTGQNFKPLHNHGSHRRRRFDG